MAIKISKGKVRARREQSKLDEKNWLSQGKVSFERARIREKLHQQVLSRHQQSQGQFFQGKRAASKGVLKKIVTTGCLTLTQ